MMKTKLIEQRRVLSLSCYREEKYQEPPRATEAEKARLAELRRCQFGLTELGPSCHDCRWLRVNKVGHGGVPLMAHHDVTEAQLAQLREDYRSQTAGMLPPPELPGER